MFQEASYQNTLREINSAQAYVESLSDEELERTLIALDQLDPEVISQEANTLNK